MSTEVSNPDPATVVIKLKQPYSPLLPLLAYFSAPAVVMPKRLALSNEPVKEFIGTGPYKLIEHAPDKYVRVGEIRQIRLALRHARWLLRPPRSPDR